MERFLLVGKIRVQLVALARCLQKQRWLDFEGKGKQEKILIAGIHKSVGAGVYVLGKRIGYAKDVMFTGGIANNMGVRRAIERVIGMEILTPADPQIVGAFGRRF